MTDTHDTPEPECSECGGGVASRHVRGCPETTRDTPEAAPEKVPFHCANDCPMKDVPKDYSAANTDDLFPCGWRHWCPWCGDCEYCYDEGPHDWD